MMLDGKKSIANRIGLMIEAVTKATGGDGSIRLETSGQDDELDSLTRGINALLDSV